LALFAWFMFGIAGWHGMESQRPTPTPQERYLCAEPLPPDRDANGRLRNSFCASIEGVVVRASSNVGIANARVRLGPPNSGALADSLEAVADSNGKFLFPSINPVYFPGGYNISASAEGYQSGAYGQVGVNALGEAIILPGGTRRQLTIKLNPYQAASGTIHTLDLEPVAAAVVRAYRIQYTPLGRRLRIARTVLSNDLGDYRVIGIEPWDYYVSASYSEKARELQITGLLLTPNLSNPDSGYVTTYYPATDALSNASPFTVVPAAEKSGLDITLRETDRFQVHVRVFSKSTQQGQQFSIAMLPAGMDLGDAPDYAVSGNGGSDFDIRGVAPGHYSLVAFDKSRILSEVVPVTVDHDLDDIRIPIYDPLDIPGVVVDEYGNSIPGKMRVRLVRADPELGQTIPSDVDSGSFMVPNVGPGAYDVYVDGLPSGTYIKEVRFPVNDNRFGRIRIDAEKPSRTLDETTRRWRTESAIEVVLTRTNAVVEGTVWTGAKRNGMPVGVAGAQVVLVPDRQQDNTYGQREDRFILGNTDSGGRFQLKGVPPGIYTALGFVEIQPGLYYDPQFNDRVSNLGVKVIVAGNETLELTQCEPNRPPDFSCLLRVPREQSYGIAP